MEEVKHVDAEHREHAVHPMSASMSSQDYDSNHNDIEKRAYAAGTGNVIRDDDAVTAKTWAVVFVLAASYGISFFPVPFFSTIQSEMAVSFGSSPALGTWFTSVYSLGGTIAFMLCGANSDLFGRRTFILLGNLLMIIGAILGGTSHTVGQTVTAHVFMGFGGGNCQIAAFALPELLPNKWRHIGVVIADAGIYFDVIVGPVVARIAYKHGAWRFGYWGILIAQAISMLVLVFFYYPPAHPRGIPWGQALRDLDYVGMFTFTVATAGMLSGIVYALLLPSKSPVVIALLVVGCAFLVIFALWETFGNPKEPIAPTRLFTANKGRRLTAPFVCGFVVTMFYYANNITWPTMLGVYFTNANTPPHIVYLLATVQGFGIFTGAMLLSFFGSTIKNWKWQMTASITIMTFFGALFAYITPERESIGIAFAFLSSMGYGYAQYLSIAYIQLGADQIELGIAGGLAGVARYAGGAVAVTLFATILGTVQSSWASTHVVAAAEAAGASRTTAEAVLAALPLGAAALEKVQGLTTAIATAAGGAFIQSYVEGVRKVAFASLAFGGCAIIASLFLEDIGPKMNNKIEVFLENDVQAEKNVYH